MARPFIVGETTPDAVDDWITGPTPLIKAALERIKGMLPVSGQPRTRWMAIILRALSSTVLILAIALTVSALRSGRFQWPDVKLLLARYWGLGVAVFAFVVIWDLWFQRARRPRIVDHD